MPKQSERFVPGARFGMLTAIVRAGSNGRTAIWRLRCDCGNEVERPVGNLYRPRAHNCGCYRPQNFAKGGVGNRRTHNRSFDRLYFVWGGMKQRCYNPNTRQFDDYGGRGIYICDEWLNSFQAFAEWAERNGYAAGLQIDRRDNDGPYAPWNCRFVTPAVNQKNRRPVGCGAMAARNRERYARISTAEPD
jgi:hypothetical protein